MNESQPSKPESIDAIISPCAKGLPALSVPPARCVKFLTGLAIQVVVCGHTIQVALTSQQKSVPLQPLFLSLVLIS